MSRRRFAFAPTVRAALGAAVLTLAASGIAAAQPALSVAPPAATQPAAVSAPPSYATPTTEEQISGSVTAVTGKYTLQIRDTRGFLDNVTLHPGTVINPTGLKLEPGMQVAITGVNAGSSFTANQIDAPYAIALMGRPGYDAGVGFGFGFGGWGWGPGYRAGFLW
jgi:hypothetical protein